METWREQLYLDELYHHGIKGMRWGQRRFQNADGSLTSAGASRYGHSLRGNLHRLAAANYGLNERTYKRGKSKFAKEMAKKNRAARADSLRKAAAADKKAYEARERKRSSRDARRSEKVKSSTRSTKTRRSLKGNYYRMSAAYYKGSERVAGLLGNKAVAGMSRSVQDYALKKAEAADRAAQERRERRRRR